MKKVLMWVGGIGLLLIGVIVVVALVAKAKLEPFADQFLADCQAGRYEEVYAGSAKAFRDATSLEGFQRYMEVRRRALGDYHRITGTTGGGMSTSSSDGTVGTVSADLEYAKGSAKGEFQFQKDGDTWRIRHAKITFDPKLMPGPDRPALDPLSRDLLKLYDESAFVALYERFSKPLQEAWKAETYEQQVKDLRAKTGKVLEAKLREVKDGDDGKVQAVFDVRFEAGTGEGVFGWLWSDADWYLVGFDLHIGAK